MTGLGFGVSVGQALGSAARPVALSLALAAVVFVVEAAVPPGLGQVPAFVAPGASWEEEELLRLGRGSVSMTECVEEEPSWALLVGESGTARGRRESVAAVASRTVGPWAHSAALPAAICYMLLPEDTACRPQRRPLLRLDSGGRACSMVRLRRAPPCSCPGTWAAGGGVGADDVDAGGSGGRPD
jgi:hypothetical protein